MSAAPGITLAQFETLDFDPESYDHEAHVHTAWMCLRQYPLTRAIEVYSSTLQRLTQQLGVPEKYHATITWFYLLVISERLSDRPDADWAAFSRANPDLFAGPDNVLKRYYDPEWLTSEAARHRFHLPRPNSAAAL